MTVHFDSTNSSGDVGFHRTGAGSTAHRGSPYKSAGKRIFDLLVVIAASPIIVPVITLLTLAIWFSGNRPFFVQERVGRGGRIFRMLKFRTMVDDAETVLEAYLEGNQDARAEWDTHQKLKNDPRITAAGRFLRKTSLDELPQFWNVLVGDMSIVGPRPMTPNQKPLYPGEAYYRMRPGITGLWQISDRNQCEFRERAAFDTQYETLISFGADLSILRRTVGVVLRGTGY